MNTIEQLSKVGQVEPGDVILCTYKGGRFKYDVAEVLFPGEDTEEVILDKKRNKYFITAMAIDGSSWAEDVQVIHV